MEMGKPLQRDGILSRQLGDEWILYDSQKGAVHIINSMAEFIWGMCDGSRNLSDIENKVREVYQVPEGTNLKNDLQCIIQSFADKGMIADKTV